jgi:hypothetical protein
MHDRQSVNAEQRLHPAAFVSSCVPVCSCHGTECSFPWLNCMWLKVRWTLPVQVSAAQGRWRKAVAGLVYHRWLFPLQVRVIVQLVQRVGQSNKLVVTVLCRSLRIWACVISSRRTSWYWLLSQYVTHQGTIIRLAHPLMLSCCCYASLQAMWARAPPPPTLRRTSTTPSNPPRPPRCRAARWRGAVRTRAASIATM